ncbi:hypothetical protein B296_00005411 [Ensete ventricosum]|uniref:Uncharacterized protein n=1 Tax=Ensete ventricosum TaxID=4639 RepID=A0A427ABM9_ENSVE|nr:hypothetical protein B296_00005411 [Ensete ventricosum]
MTNQDNQHLTPANPVASSIIAVSLPIVSRCVPSELPDPFGESRSERWRDPTASSEPDPMLKLDLGPLSGCNFIALVIVSPI